MAETRPILIASDLSPTSDLAVTRGLQLAVRHGRPLLLLHAIREEPLWWVVQSRELDPASLRAELEREAIAGMHEQVRLGADRLGLEPPEIDARVCWGKPAAAITEAANARDAAMVLAGAHGNHLVSDWVLGSTAEKLVRAGQWPVLVVRGAPERHYKRVVVGVDFSAASRAALAAALDWARGASFTLVHAYETWFETYIDPATYERLRQEQESALHERLRAFAREAGVRPGDNVDYRVVTGLPGMAVVDLATEIDAGLTVCGTQGETGLRHLLLGSVAQHVLRESRSDVLAVRATDDGS